ncbi:MAG: S41 family peptidase [Candidatus Cloacimonetes bacterium]|nr:S41 family peptidase [Candidatus Cloacimonadota bacterium]
MFRNKKIMISINIIGWLVVSFLLFNNTALAQTSSQRTNNYMKLSLFSDVLRKISDNYVEEVDFDKLIDAAIKGMLDELDPHTTYFVPDDYDRFQADTKGEFGGLGISIDKKGDYITVVSPIEGTPAYEMGILSGDKIVKVDGESVVGIDTRDSIKLMRGEPGTKVVITIKRPGAKDLLDFEIIRDIIKIESVPYAFKMDNGIGYLRIRQFSATTSNDLRKKLDELESEGIRGLIVDLRFNPGGLLNEAVNTVNEFIGKDKRVVFTKGRIKEANHEYFTRYNRIRTGYPVIVMINEASASASEIFAGSLQDYDKGLIVGKTSFGKGSVQKLFPLSDGNGIKITTSKYYINSERCIHKDLNDKLLKDKRIRNGDISKEEIEEMKKESEEEHIKDIHYTESGRVVYGGGGINPDVEIEQDKLTKLGVELRRKNLMFNYAIDYMVENENDVTLNFRAGETMVSDFMEFTQKDSIEYEQTELDSTYNWLENTLTSNIIRRKFGDLESYKISIKEDNQLQEAIKIFDRFPSLVEMFTYAEEEKKSDESEFISEE